MTQAPSDGYSTSELADKIAKLGVNFSDLDSDNDPDDEYILDQYLYFVFIQDVAKDVYGDPKASNDAMQLAKAVLGMSQATLEAKVVRMTMLDKPSGRVEPVTRAWDARLARIEERIAKSEQNTEQRVLILRDAMSDFVADFITNRVAPLHDEIVALKKSNAELKKQLQEKSDVDKRVEEVMKRLDARQLARDEAKRGKMGPQGQRGARGERGPVGPRGPAGKPAKPAASFHSWHVDKDTFRVTVFFSDGTSLPPLDLMPLFKTYDEMTR